MADRFIFGPSEKDLLKALIQEVRISNSRLQCIEDLQRETNHLVRQLLIPEVTGFSIQQTGDSPMALVAPDPGNTLVFTATPTPAGAQLPPGVVPVWTSSDPTLAPVTADPTGLIGTVALDPSIPVGESVTLTVTATLPDGTTPTGSTSFTVGAPPPPVVTGFTIVQTT